MQKVAEKEREEKEEDEDDEDEEEEGEDDVLGLAKAGQGWAGGGKRWGDISGFERERGRKFWGEAERSENGCGVGQRG